MAGRTVTSNQLADELIAELRTWPVPEVASEKELDLAVKEFVRAKVKRRIPDLPVKQWIAGHGEARPDDRFWTESKKFQNVTLWGASKTCDLFIYHREGKWGLSPKGISFEVKYVPPGESYAGAIATVAGQLIAYSLRHGRTIGFVWIAQSQRSGKGAGEAGKDRAEELQRKLPANATLIVRFKS